MNNSNAIREIADNFNNHCDTHNSRNDYVSKLDQLLEHCDLQNLKTASDGEDEDLDMVSDID